MNKSWRSPAERHALAAALSLFPEGYLLIQLLAADVNVRAAIYINRLPKSGWHRAGRLTLATWSVSKSLPLIWGKRMLRLGFPPSPGLVRSVHSSFFPPLAKKIPFKDPTALAGGLQLSHQTCQ